MPGIWTCVGSAFVPDEDSAGKYEFSAARFRHKGINIGTISACCNVTNPLDNGESDPNWNNLEVIYYNQKETNQVKVELIRVSNENGGIWTMATFESTTTNKDCQPGRVSFDRSFNFLDFAYYVKITVKRTSTAEENNPCVCIVRLSHIDDIF